MRAGIVIAFSVRYLPRQRLRAKLPRIMKFKGGWFAFAADACFMAPAPPSGVRSHARRRYEIHGGYVRYALRVSGRSEKFQDDLLKEVISISILRARNALISRRSHPWPEDSNTDRT